MTLNSALFVAFVLAALLLAYLFPKKLRYLWLLCVSYGFYIFASKGFPLQTPAFLLRLGFGPSLPAFLPGLVLLVGVTLAGWLCGLLLHKSANKWLRVFFLCLGAAFVAGLWAACKYLGLLAPFKLHVGGIVTQGTANGFVQIAIPMGLSYYTLQVVGYLFDVYQGRARAEMNPLRYASFIAFFPGIVLGPTARAGQMLPQLKNPAPFDYDRITGGAFRILWGFFKKLVLADNLSFFTAYIFGATTGHPGPLILLASLLFVWQVYLDFSGCCDIAIGAARTLGFDFAENFMRPFSAKSFAGFWRRWFMSFSGLLRDIVYTPLTQNRLAAKFPLLRGPLMLAAGAATFLLLGAWHGLAKDYLYFGLATGLLFGLSQFLQPLRDRVAARVPVYKIPWVRGVFQRVFTFLLFWATMLFFASALYEQPFFEWFKSLFAGWDVLKGNEIWVYLYEAGLTAMRRLVLLVGSALVIGIEHFAVSTEGSVASWMRERRFFIRWPIYLALIAALLLFGVYPVSLGLYQIF